MKSSSGKKTADIPFKGLTWTDLEEWAGAEIISRGREYQRSGCVEDLGITPKNELIAWVQGSVLYAVRVKYQRGKLCSVCTCPYSADCKHAVAAVIDYLNSVKNGKTIPLVQKGDERLKMIQ